MSGAIRADVAQAIVGSANQGIVVIDERGTLRSFNSAAERIFGYRASEILGRSASRLLPERERSRYEAYLARRLGSAPAGAAEPETRLDGQRRDGTVFPMEISLAELEIEGRPHLSCIVRDVSRHEQARSTDRTEPTADRAARPRMAEAVNRVLRGFVGTSLWNRKELFGEALESVLALTGSEFGFIGEVLHTAEGRPFLKAHAISDIAWDGETRRRYRRESRSGLEFRELSNLLGATLRSGERVLSNDPSADPRSGGLPPGHPRLDAYLGLPVHASGRAGAGGRLLGMVGLANRHGGYDEELADSLGPFLEAVGAVIAGFQDLQIRRKAEQDLYRAQQRLRIVAAEDPLTEIPDRQSLMDAIDDAFPRLRALEIPFSAVLVDVDHLKRINDEHGNLAGDHVLRHLARLLRETIRPADILGRYGGEKFVMAFLECDEPFAEIVAERLRLRVEGEPFPIDEAGRRSIEVTISAGVASRNDATRDARDLVERADRAACDAKQAGRNCVRVHRRSPDRHD